MTHPGKASMVTGAFFASFASPLSTLMDVVELFLMVGEKNKVE